MKTRYKLLGFLAAGLFAFSSCSEDKVTVEIPSDISNVRSTAGAGNIELRWDLPADSNLFYVEVRYKDPKTNEKIRRHISKHADSLLVKGLLKKYGTIDFEVQSYSMTGGNNQIHNIADASLYAPVDTLYHSTDIELPLSTENVSTNAQEPKEGPLSNLFDDDNSTFFHSIWSASISEAHYLEFDFQIETYGIQYETVNRSNGNNMPLAVDFYGSNDRTNWIKVAQLDNGMPEGASAVYKSPLVGFGGGYRYIRFTPSKIKGGTKFFALAGFKAFKVDVEIRDPEKD